MIDKEQKKWSSPKLYLHAFIHGLLAFILLGKPSLWYLAVLVLVIHYFIDLLKLTFQNVKSKQGWFISDQIFHIISLSVLWAIIFEPRIEVLRIYQNQE